MAQSTPPASMQVPPLARSIFNHPLIHPLVAQDLLHHRPAWVVLSSAAVLLGIKDVLFSLLDPRFAWQPLATAPLRVLEADPLVDSGMLVLLLGLYLARPMQRHVEQAVERLALEGVLTVDGQPLDMQQFPRLKHELQRRALRWATAGRIVVGATILSVYVFVLAIGLVITIAAWLRGGGERSAILIELSLLIMRCLLYLAAGLAIGGVIGRAFVYGRLVRFLDSQGIGMKASPWHLDGAAGFKAIGELYSFQAAILMLPVGFFSVWWYLITFVSGPHKVYGTSEIPHLCLYLLVAALVVAQIGWLAPLYSFHTRMCADKAGYLAHAAELSLHVAALRSGDSEAMGADSVTAQVAPWKDRYMSIVQMPTWPFDPSTDRWFKIKNLALILPLINVLFPLPQLVQNILGALANLIRG